MPSESVEKGIEIGAIAIFTALNGWLGWLIILYIGSMAFDWLTGSALAIKNKEWNSTKARLGLWHKCGSVITVAVSALTDILLGLIVNNVPGFQLPFSYHVLLCPIVLIWYILAELGSCLENASNMGAPVPSFLKDVLEKASAACNSKK